MFFNSSENSASNVTTSNSNISNSTINNSNATTCKTTSVLSNFSATLDSTTVDMSNLNNFSIFEFQEKTAVELAVESALEFTVEIGLSGGSCEVTNEVESFNNYNANGYEISMENNILYTCNTWNELLLPASYSSYSDSANSPSMNSTCTLVDDLDYTHDDDDYSNDQKCIESIKTAARGKSKKRNDQDIDLVKLKNNKSAKKCYAKKKENLEKFKSLCLHYLNDLFGRVQYCHAYTGFQTRYNDIIMSLQPLKQTPKSELPISTSGVDSTDRAATRRARGTQSASRRRLAKKNATANFEILAQDLTAYFKNYII